MKLALFLSLAILSLIPAQLCATIVRVDQWQRPDGTSIIILGDMHIDNSITSQQRNALLDHLRSNRNAQLIVEDDGLYRSHNNFLPTLVKEAQEKGIDALSIEFREFNESKKHNLHYCNVLNEKRASIEAAITALNNENISEDFKYAQSLLETLKESVEKDGKLPLLLHPQLDVVERGIFNYACLAAITNSSIQKKDIYICVGEFHAQFLTIRLEQLGYAPILRKSGYTENDWYALANDLDRTGNKSLWDFINKHALDLKDPLQSIESNQEREAALQQELQEKAHQQKMKEAQLQAELNQNKSLLSRFFSWIVDASL